MPEPGRETIGIIVKLVATVTLPFLRAEPLSKLPNAVFACAAVRSTLSIALCSTGDTRERKSNGRDENELHDA